MAPNAVVSPLDAWLTKQPRATQDLFRRGATPAELARTSKLLGTDIPPALQALYAWRDGEDACGVFDALLRAHFEPSWKVYSDEPLEVRWMPLAEVGRAGSYAADREDDDSLVRNDENGSIELIPFLWLRGKIAKKADRDDDDDDDDDDVTNAPARVPIDDDWLVAVSSDEGDVVLFEIGDEGLSGIQTEGADLESWLGHFAARLTRGEVRFGTERPAPKLEKPKITPPQTLLVKLLLEKELVELEEGTSAEELADRIAPLLVIAPEKAAVKAVLDFLDDDPSVAEIFAEERILRALVSQFVG